MPRVRTSFSLLYLIFLGVFPVLFSSLTLFYVYQYGELLLSFSYLEWSLIFLCSSLTMAFALTPTTLVALCSGYFLGATAIWFVIPAYLLASIIGFFSARFIDGGSLLKAVSQKPKAKNFVQNLNQKSFGFVVLSRLSPVLPFALMNFVLAALKVPFRTFMLAGFIGMLPRTLLFIWVGSEAKNLAEAIAQPEQNNFIRWVVIALIIGSVLGLSYVVGRAMKKSERIS